MKRFWSDVTDCCSIFSASHNYARAGQLTSEVVSVDDHLSLGQLSATQLSENLSHFEIQGNSGTQEEAIIELDQSPMPLR